MLLTLQLTINNAHSIIVNYKFCNFYFKNYAESQAPTQSEDRSIFTLSPAIGIDPI